MVGTVLRSYPRRAVVVAVVLTMVSTSLVVEAARPARATSNGIAYDVPVAVDTNPAADVFETTLTAQEATVDIGGGRTAKALTFNGAIPGPELRLHVNDTVIVHMKNDLTHPTGIHWHGIELANGSDGTPLTQNMVDPGKSFLYKFKVIRPGTFWYHPHHHSSTNQVFKGMYGSIVVTEPAEATLQGNGVLPSPANTRSLVLGDITVCKMTGSNDAATYDPSLPWAGGGPLPVQQAPHPTDLCDTPINEDGAPIGAPLNPGDVPNIQRTSGPSNEGQTVLTNGRRSGRHPRRARCARFGGREAHGRPRGGPTPASRQRRQPPVLQAPTDQQRRGADPAGAGRR